MVLGGIQKNSFIDYPGKISCVLFVFGCNFDCPYCHNPSLVKGNPAKDEKIEEDVIFDFLRSRREFLDGVVISGGEPTLRKDLVSFCERVKDMGYPIKLDTNGSRPKVLDILIRDDLVDYIAMDIKTIPEMYGVYIKRGLGPQEILASIRLIMESGKDYEFRTTCVKPIVDDHIIEMIGGLIRGANLFALQSFVSREVLHPEFFQDIGAGYSEEELYNFKSIAEPWVKRCIVRC